MAAEPPVPDRVATDAPPRGPSRAVVAAIGVALAVALTAVQVLPVRPGEAIGRGDMDQLGHVWATWNAARGLGRAWVTPDSFYPDGLDLLVAHGGHLDVLVGAALVRLGAGPLVAHNVALAGFLALATLGGYALGFALTRSVGAAVVGGVALGWSPWLGQYAAAGLVEELFVGGIALALVGAVRCERPGWQGPTLLGAAVVATTLASWEYGMFLAGVMLVYGATALVTRRAGIGRLVAGCVGAAALLSPLVTAFLGEMGEARADLARALPRIAALTADLGMREAHSLAPADLFGRTEHGPLLLAAPVALALATSLGRARRHAPLVAVGLGFLALSAGPAVVVGGVSVPLPYAALAKVAPFLRWFHWPERFGAVVLVVVAGFAAVGVARLAAGWLGRFAVPLAVVAILANGALLPTPWFPRQPKTRLPPAPAAYACFGDGAVVEAPLPAYDLPDLLGLERHDRPGVAGGVNRHAQLVRWWETSHGRPIVGGPDIPHTVPAAWRERVAADPTLRMLALASAGVLPGEPPDGAAAKLEALGVAGIVVNARAYADRETTVAVLAWLDAAYGRPACGGLGKGWASYAVRPASEAR